jgi:outer membrane protein assembly factor BamB
VSHPASASRRAIASPRLAAACRLLTVGISLMALSCGSEGSVAPGKGGVVPEDSSAVPRVLTSVEITGVPPAEQRLYIGRTLRLWAEPYDQHDTLMAAMPIVWSSSNALTADVDHWGHVRLRAAGSVVITATIEEKADTVSLVIVPVPVTAVRVTPLRATTYVGLPVSIAAMPVDSIGGKLADRAVTWASSDERLATMDTTGQVTPLAPGTVSVTAQSEGKSAVVAITVLPRPIADWSGVTEDWVTYQGNAGHTAHVPATLDPVVFKRGWEYGMEGASPHPVVVAEGRVFVAAATRGGGAGLVVLDASTGEERQSHALGLGVEVNPPAYGDGTVYVTTNKSDVDTFLWAFDASTGVERFRSPYGSQGLPYQAPVVIGGTVYAAGGEYSGLYAYDARDGAVRWFVPEFNNFPWWTPAVRDGWVYVFVASYVPTLTVFDAATGAVDHEILDRTVEWSGVDRDVSAVLGSSNNALVTTGGRLVSFDLVNRRVGWEQPGAFLGNLSVANGVIYVLNGRQIEARRESDGSFLWAWAPPEGEPAATTVATANLLFVSTAANTYAVDLDARTHTWSHPVGGSLALSKQGMLLIARPGKIVGIAVK